MTGHFSILRAGIALLLVVAVAVAGARDGIQGGVWGLDLAIVSAHSLAGPTADSLPSLGGLHPAAKPATACSEPADSHTDCADKAPCCPGPHACLALPVNEPPQFHGTTAIRTLVQMRPPLHHPTPTLRPPIA